MPFLSVSGSGSFSLFRKMPSRYFSVSQKRVATRSVKKGLGIPNKQAQIRKPLRVCPACQLVKVKMSKITLFDGLDRQDILMSDLDR